MKAGGRGLLLALGGVLLLALLWTVAACSASAQKGRGAEMPPPSRSAAAADDPYTFEPEPMTTAECGRCHTRHFRELREEGGLHRFDCRGCHEVFHAYSPRKENFAELMPQCGKCHGLPHGERHTACLSCHDRPHAPGTVPLSHLLVAACAECHPSPEAQLRQFSSAHSVQGCQSCHPQRHGKILACSSCHPLHYDAQPVADCARCHPAHKPLQTAFWPEASVQTCGACHGAVLERWAGTSSRHGQLNCTECHSRHGLVPDCVQCHPQPHSENFLSRFPACLDCHLDAHNLPVQ